MNVLVDTTPMNAFKPGILNYGYEVVSRKWDLHKVHWRDVVDLTDVKSRSSRVNNPSLPSSTVMGKDNELLTDARGLRYICFNVTYPLYIMNIAPFLRANGVESLACARQEKRQPKVIVGGAGVSNLRGCLDEIVDAVFTGELDAEMSPEIPAACPYHRLAGCWRSILDTPPVVKSNAGTGNSTAVLELTRGCPHACLFCEYSWAIGGPYREKKPDIVIAQLDDLLSEYPSLRRKGLTLRTSSWGSYRYLREVTEALCERNMKLPWADVNPQDFLKVYDFIKPLGTTRLHLGVESFTEGVRRSAGKRVSDDELAMIFRLAMQNCYWLHINLIFGLPGEDDVDPPYQRWFDWVKRIDSIRKKIRHKLRIDFLITNFEPSRGTPYEASPAVDFDIKDRYFLPKWISLLQELGFYTLGKRQRIWYGSDFGRHGRKQLAHELIMAIRHGGTELTSAICNAFPSGVRRYTTDKQAERFFNLIDKSKR